MATNQRDTGAGQEGKKETSGAPAPSAQTQTAGPLKPFEDAVYKYTSALRDVWNPVEAQRRVSETQVRQQVEYLRQIQTLPQGQNQMIQLLEVQTQYMRALQEAWLPESARGRFVELYRQFLRELKQAWAGLDVATVEPRELALAGQLLYSVATLVAPQSEFLRSTDTKS